MMKANKTMDICQSALTYLSAQSPRQLIERSLDGVDAAEQHAALHARRTDI